MLPEHFALLFRSGAQVKRMELTAEQDGWWLESKRSRTLRVLWPQGSDGRRRSKNEPDHSGIKRKFSKVSLLGRSLTAMMLLFYYLHW